jgi:DNA-binding CsgD family transcriptional regulator
LVDSAEAIFRFENGDREGGLDGFRSSADRILTELDSDPLGRGVVASRVLIARALAEAHGGRPEAALMTARQLEALCPEPFNDVTADLAYVLARAGAAIGDREAIASARRHLAVIRPVAPGPNAAAAAEAVEAYAGTGPVHDRFVRAAKLYEQAPRAVLAAEMWCEAARTACSPHQRGFALERARGLCAAHGLARVSALADEIASSAKLGPDSIGDLTPRERDVVLLAAVGLSNRQIGARLYLAEGTVRNYLSTAFDKIGVSRRSELASRLSSMGPDLVTGS